MECKDPFEFDRPDIEPHKWWPLAWLIVFFLGGLIWYWIISSAVSYYYFD